MDIAANATAPGISPSSAVAADEQIAAAVRGQHVEPRIVQQQGAGRRPLVERSGVDSREPRP